MEVHDEWFFSNQSDAVLIYFVILHVKKIFSEQELNGNRAQKRS